MRKRKTERNRPFPRLTAVINLILHYSNTQNTLLAHFTSEYGTLFLVINQLSLKNEEEWKFRNSCFLGDCSESL